MSLFGERETVRPNVRGNTWSRRPRVNGATAEIANWHHEAWTLKGRDTRPRHERTAAEMAGAPVPSLLAGHAPERIEAMRQTEGGYAR